MPRTVEAGFRAFLRKLTPSSGESSAAKRHRASIKECLERNFNMLSFFQSGSFGNGTSISGYSDVDYFARIPSNNLIEDSNTSLRKVRDALDTQFSNTDVRVSCPAVKVPFGTLGKESIEVVPADYIKKSPEGHHIYEIPNCEGGWMRSSPEAHTAYVRDVDTKLRYKVRPLIRFIKAWKYFRNVPISSFYLELRVAKYAEGQQSSIIYSKNINNILKRLYDHELADMRDPKGYLWTNFSLCYGGST